MLDDLQQLVTPDTLLLALQFAREAGEQGRQACGGLGMPAQSASLGFF